MLSPQEAVVQWMYRLTDDQAIRPFSDLIVQAVMETRGTDPLMAQSVATANTRRYWNAIKKRSADDLVQGRNPCIHCLNDTLYQYHDSVTRLRGMGRNDEASLLRARSRVLRLLDNCTAREYEAAACAAMRIVGARETHLTPARDEGGVDFFALMDCEARTHLFGKSHRALRIVGQSKQYDTRESVTRFNAFVKVLENVRHRHSTVVDHIPGWFGRGNGPIIGLYIAHHGLQSGAHDIAREHGIVVADSIDLSEMVALSSLLPADAEPDNRASEYLQMVKSIVAEYE